VLAALIPAITGLIGKAIDKAVPDADQAARLKGQVLEQVNAMAAAELKGAIKIILAEARGGSWLQRSWRPLLMLTFAGLIVARWFGFTAPGITEAVELELWSLVKIGIGGYVVGRSAEKVASSWRGGPG